MHYFNFSGKILSIQFRFPAKLLLFLVILSPLLLASCGKKKKDLKAKGPAGPTVVDVIVAGSQNISSDLEVNGTVIANEFVQLMPEVSGRLTYLHVPEGRYVKKGTVIARINDADLQAQLGKSKVQLDLAQISEQRLKKLIAINGVNQAEYDIALNQVNALKADLLYTQALIDKTVIKAPFSGLVGLRNVSEGAFVTSSTVISTIQEISRLKVDFTVPEEFRNLITTGKSIDIVLDQNGDNRKKATIIATEPQVNVNTRNILVRAVLQSTTTSPGAFAKVYLGSGSSTKSIVVPTSCIIPEAKSKKIIVVRNGKAEMVNVETGSRREGLAEVTKGISEGDSVVVTGVLFAKPGAKVSVRNVKKIDEFAN